jgi:hypothetical protein
MSKKIVKLSGKLVGGIVGPGGETTGFAIQVGQLDANTSAVKDAAEFANLPCVIAGSISVLNDPARKNVLTIEAVEIQAIPSKLSRKALEAPAFLSGTLTVGIKRPGGDGPSSELTGVAPEADVSGVAYQNFLNRQVNATGVFEEVNYVERGRQFVFKILELG